MSNLPHTKLAFGLIVSAALFATTAAHAEMMTFTAEMTGAAQVPPNDSPAKGTAEVILDTDAKTITWTYTNDGLTGAPTAAHIHGPAGPTEVAGPVIDTLIEGSSPITETQISDLTAGNYYFNVHTAEYPDGEIRGQLAVMQ